MFGEKALELVKELYRTKGGNVTTYNEDIVRQVLDEMRALFEQNQADVNAAMDGEQHLYPAIQIRHAALERNKRCLLSYLYNRLQLIRQMRWDFGSVLPADIKFCLAEQEAKWFGTYNKMLATYMRSIGEHGGLDLTQDIRPPKTLYIEVRCLADHGEFETNEGIVISLKKNSQEERFDTSMSKRLGAGLPSNASPDELRRENIAYWGFPEEHWLGNLREL